MLDSGLVDSLQSLPARFKPEFFESGSDLVQAIEQAVRNVQQAQSGQSPRGGGTDAEAPLAAGSTPRHEQMPATPGASGAVVQRHLPSINVAGSRHVCCRRCRGWRSKLRCPMLAQVSPPRWSSW
jgi:hypothetical protein